MVPVAHVQLFCIPLPRQLYIIISYNNEAKINISEYAYTAYP